MEQVVDLPAQLVDRPLGDAETGLGKVADHGHDPILVDSPAAPKLGQPALRPLADQHVDGPGALEQPLNQIAADEACGAGDEVAQSALLKSEAPCGLDGLRVRPDPTLCEVGIHLSGDPGDPGRPSTRLGRVDGSQPGAERRLIRDGVQVLAHGALVCPSCALPLGAEGRMPAGHPVRCGFCDHAGPGARVRARGRLRHTRERGLPGRPGELNNSAGSLAFGYVSGGLRRERGGRVTRLHRDFVASAGGPLWARSRA